MFSTPHKKKVLSTIFFFIFVFSVEAQSVFSGSFQSNTNFFIRDPKIGASNLPHYDNLKIGSDIWLNLNYNNEKLGLDVGIRGDAYLNSILRNPTVPITKAGLGYFFIKKRFKELAFTAGYMYGQIGSGMIYRAYEERPLGIDNALVGGKVEYNGKHVKAFAFSGLQKDLFQFYMPIISGAGVEGNVTIKNKVTLVPGLGVMNRSMDQKSMDGLVAKIEALDTSLRFVPKYNVYAFTFYNTLTAGDFAWYIEGAYKTKDAFYGANNVLLNKPGNAILTSVSYSKRGIGVSLQFKRTENFQLRTSPNETLFRGSLNFQPPIARQNSLRLPARYFAPALNQQEIAFGGEINYSPNKKWRFLANFSEIRDFFFKPSITSKVDYKPNTLGGIDTISTPIRSFFREGLLLAEFKPNKKFQFDAGFQYIFYNRQIYIGDGEINVTALTPFVEFQHKFNKKMSYRVEVQYQYVPKDYGQWIYALVEFNIAPMLSISVSDMWNFKPNPDNPLPVYTKPLHFYSVFAAYTYKSNRFTLNYARQVGGIVCTGGVCRYEPAFSGVRLGINSTF